MNKNELIDAVAERTRSEGRCRARRRRRAGRDHRHPEEGRAVTLSASARSLSRRGPPALAAIPRTGETIQIAASKVPGFKAGKA